MFKKLSISYNLVKISFSYIKRDGELLVYSIFSLLSSLAILITFLGVDMYYIGFIDSLSNGAQGEQVISEGIGYAMMFLYYFIFSFITFFFNTAIITSVQRRNEGKDSKLGDGLRGAMDHIKEILIWSLINAGVTTILKILQNKFGEDSVVGKIIIGIVGGLWNVLTFFSFPLMIINGLGPKEAIKESSVLFKKTWGERAIIHVGVGLLFFFLYVALFIFCLAIAFTGLYVVSIVVLLLGIVFLATLSSTSDVIIKTILLHFAKYGELPVGLENEKSIIELAGEK